LSTERQPYQERGADIGKRQREQVAGDIITTVQIAAWKLGLSATKDEDSKQGKGNFFAD